MTLFLLIRHGETDWSLPAAKGAKGWSADLAPLTDNGISQVRNAIPEIRDWSPELILSSPATRALSTCALIATELQIPFKVEFDLHEWVPDNSLSWQSHQDVANAQKEMENCGGEWPNGKIFPWEPLSHVKSRVHVVLKRYMDYQKVAVACHELVIRSLTNQKTKLAESVEYIYPTLKDSD